MHTDGYKQKKGNGYLGHREGLIIVPDAEKKGRSVGIDRKKEKLKFSDRRGPEGKIGVTRSERCSQEDSDSRGWVVAVAVAGVLAWLRPDVL
ncbi:hypothetical protein NL676_007894 [Syzygium grande]|nr:hypothetical protein NL676_007894 [Syzygium grande]